MMHSGNRRIIVLAAGLSLITHIALATIFIDKNNEAQIEGGSAVSISVMGDASIDQVMAGELNPNDVKPHQDPSEEISQLELHKPEEALVDQSNEIAALEAKPMAQQIETFAPLEELEAKPLKSEVTPISPTQTLTRPEIEPEKVELKTASIIQQSNAPGEIPLVQQNHLIEQDLREKPTEVMAAYATTEAVETVNKPIEQLKAQTPNNTVPVPQFRPLEDYQKQVKTASLSPNEPLKKTKKTNVRKKVETKKATSGNKGKNEANIKKGTQTSKAKKGKVTSKKQGNSKTAGNGNITNYKGKVRRKIASRFNPRTRPAKRDAVVSFTIGKTGSANSVRLARSSGNAKLDRAALSAVRKASPFPSLPSGNTRLAFSVPLNAR